MDVLRRHMCIGGYTAVARGVVRIGSAVFGNVRGNGERVSAKDKDYSDDDSTSSSSRHKTIERDTKMMTTATTHAQKQLHTHMCTSKIHPRRDQCMYSGSEIENNHWPDRERKTCRCFSIVCVVCIVVVAVVPLGCGGDSVAATIMSKQTQSRPVWVIL